MQVSFSFELLVRIFSEVVMKIMSSQVCKPLVIVTFKKFANLQSSNWNLILRPERPNLEASLTRWRATTCHFDISVEKAQKPRQKHS